MARGRRVKLDVRWDAEDVASAEVAARASGVRTAVVMRAAVKIGLASRDRAGALRAESTAEGERARAGVRAVRGGGQDAGAAAAPPGGAPSGPSSRPAPAAQPQQRKLAIVVARKFAALGGNASGPIPPADGARAVRAIKAGRISVDGVVVRDPNVLVDPRVVAVTS